MTFAISPLAGCGADAVPTTPAPVSASQTTGTSTRYVVSGRVTDFDGNPIAGAVVEVDHGWVPSSPETSRCFKTNGCWVATRTNTEGEYTLEFEGGPGMFGNIGYVYSFASGYDTDVQWVPAGSNTVTQHLRLPADRPLVPGQSTTVSVGPADTLCTDLEDWWIMDKRCRVIQIAAGSAGTITIDVTPAAGGPAPYLFWATTGNYDGAPRRSGTTLTIPVRGGTYRIFVGIPEGTPALAFDVVTAFR